MDFFNRISEFIYSWALDKLAPSFFPIYSNLGKGGHGMFWGFIFLLIVSLLAVLVYYKGVASKVKNCNWRNYFIVLVLGLVTLWVVNVVGFSCLIQDTKHLFDWNLIKFGVIDAVYYVVLFEAFTWIVKGNSNDSNRCLYYRFFPNKKNKK